MAVRIAIIGLGQIGASFGLALAGQAEKIQRLGYDRDGQVARRAEKMGAVDRLEGNIRKAVKDAELVLLCLPADQLHEALDAIGAVLKEGAVVIDTSPAKDAAAAWAAQALPPGRHYVGLTPVLNALYLHESQTGPDAAHADLFQKGLIAIVAPAQTDSAAIKLAADLTKLVGASPLFTDALEIDGLVSAVHLLPQLISAAYLNMALDQPGWRESRKVAGRAFAHASAPLSLLSTPQELSAAALNNRENALRLLGDLVAELQALRAEIEKKDEASLNERFELAWQGRDIWWKERQKADWTGEGAGAIELPDSPGLLSRLFGLGGKPQSKKP
jgi:prephenate dehydrogenase